MRGGHSTEARRPFNIHEYEQAGLALEKTFRRRTRGLALRDRGVATGNLLFQAANARLQLMGGKGGNILAQHDVGKFLARFVDFQRLFLHPLFV